MTFAEQYDRAYPFSGTVALLCEGDLIGYESALLRRWTASQLGTSPLVDVFPTGTAIAAQGVSDAIGRARPIMIIEDRDFRSPEEAEKDCKALKKNREARGVRILACKAWQRHEIENYFLDDDILTPVMTEWFGPCSERELRSTLAEILEGLSTFQAAEYALYRVRRGWVRTDPGSRLRNDLQHRPGWNDSDRALVKPDPRQVEEQLQRNLQAWSRTVHRDGELQEPFRGEVALQEYREKCEQWSAITVTDATWRMEWGGKEILHWLRIALSARFGWPDPTTVTRKPLTWATLCRRERETKDRTLEAAIRPGLVARLLDHLHSDQPSPTRQEWLGVVNTLRSARTA